MGPSGGRILYTGGISISRNKSFIVFVIISLAAVLLVIRLFVLQVISGAGLSRAASSQRMHDVFINRQRGDITDRNGIPLTCRDRRFMLLVKPLALKGDYDRIRRICRVYGFDYGTLAKKINAAGKPFIIDLDIAAGHKLPEFRDDGVSVISTLERYGPDTLAKHILGYINASDGAGGAGIEKYYENGLKTSGKNVIVSVNDAMRNPVAGLGYRVLPDDGVNKLDVRLTIDYHIQKIVEDVMDDAKMTGAVVVEDVNSGDIAAMASKPDFDPNNVAQYMESGRHELFNRAVAAYDMGSIFKLVDVAEALESGADVTGDYYCSGFINVSGRMFKCSSFDKGGHGHIDFTKAFASSCNPYFIKLGLDIGRKGLVDMARKLGLGAVTGVKQQGVDESPGAIPDGSGYYSPGDTANLSIGQGGVMCTPLQAADLVATIACGGIKNKVNIVDSIVNDDGERIRTIRVVEGRRAISYDTASQMKHMMEEVTKEGTGTRARLEKYGGAAGKTGSAETGQIAGGKPVIHAWFVGYFPLKTPRYSMAVLVEDGKSGGLAAAPVFESIAEGIMKMRL